MGKLNVKRIMDVIVQSEGIYHRLTKEGFEPLSRVMEYTDKKFLELVLPEIRRYRECPRKKKERNIKVF